MFTITCRKDAEAQRARAPRPRKAPGLRAFAPKSIIASIRRASRPGDGKRLAVAALLGLLAGAAGAITPEERPELGTFIDAMVERHGFDRAALERLFEGVTLRPRIIAAMERPREARPWHEYRRAFLTEERVGLGVRFWQRHHEALARAELGFGVPAELIVAIIGVETRYGTHLGSHEVLGTLLTLALDYPRRAEFFRRELEEFLLLTRELELDPGAVKGSYAGALGIPQFISSSYRRYAVDFDDDDRRDLFGNVEDAIGSVANFLHRHGWTAGQPVIEAARVEKGAPIDALPAGVEPALPLREWVRQGVVPVRNPPARTARAADAERAAALITLEGKAGPLHHLGYENFYVITRYNRSQNYAMAVYELARMIRRRYHGAS